MTRDLILGDVGPELANTRRVLEALPDGELTWKPHPKSMSIGDLATHLVTLVAWMQPILRDDEFDFASVPPRRESLASRDALLEEFDGHAHALESVLEGVDVSALGETWIFRNGDHVILEQPRALALRTLGISHMAHHRGQLVVYLRLLDLPVPGVYGPSADDLAG